MNNSSSAIRSLDMDSRLCVYWLCRRRAVRRGLIAPDDTFSYLHGRPLSQAAAWDAAVARWRQLPSDSGATFDREEIIDADSLAPMITWGTNPGMGISVNGTIPIPARSPSLRERGNPFRRRWPWL